mgnify:CR=1 FL=1
MTNQEPVGLPQSDGGPKREDVNQERNVIRFKRRMLEWDNPVEYVNNMYGSHPDDDGNLYFEVVFSEG